MSLLIFSDLDGSLMEHETYSVEPAKPALDAVQKRAIPLILNSSKTAIEIMAIQQLHGLVGPFICENGAALYELADAPPISFGLPCTQWLPRIHSLREDKQLKFAGFSDWSPAEISSLTGLNPEQAAQAKQREYSEPILWRDSTAAKAEFLEELKRHELQLLEGGRFSSIQSLFDKSDAMRWIAEKNKAPSSQAITVALGDSPNDSAMLNAADIAVIIKSAKSNQIHCHKAGKIIRTIKPGPAGWNDAVLEILSLFDANQLTKLSN